MKKVKAAVTHRRDAIVLLFEDDSVSCDTCGDLTEQWGANGIQCFHAHLQTHVLRTRIDLMERLRLVEDWPGEGDN